MEKMTIIPIDERRSYLHYQLFNRKKVIHMFHPLQTHEFEDEILELIDRQADFTRSDLQDIVSALVNKILEAGQNLPRIK
jgi:hypothetical protein